MDGFVLVDDSTRHIHHSGIFARNFDEIVNRNHQPKKRQKTVQQVVAAAAAQINSNKINSNKI